MTKTYFSEVPATAEGANARVAGLKEDDNPYALCGWSNKHQSWGLGWRIANEDIQKADLKRIGDAFRHKVKRELRVSKELQDHPLYEVLTSAIDQAVHGKGERHGGNKTPFLEQPWVHYAKLHGRGFLTGQAAKKLEEAAGRGLTGEAFEREVFGAIVYCGMAILRDRGTSETRPRKLYGSPTGRNAPEPETQGLPTDGARARNEVVHEAGLVDLDLAELELRVAANIMGSAPYSQADVVEKLTEAVFASEAFQNILNQEKEGGKDVD